jgi:hypothetical protein
MDSAHYVEMRANYAWAEGVANVSHDRTNLGLELGYYFNPAISARVFMSRQWTDGGIDLPIPRPTQSSPSTTSWARTSSSMSVAAFCG